MTKLPRSRSQMARLAAYESTKSRTCRPLSVRIVASSFPSISWQLLTRRRAATRWQKGSDSRPRSSSRATAKAFVVGTSRREISGNSLPSDDGVSLARQRRWHKTYSLRILSTRKPGNMAARGPKEPEWLEYGLEPWRCNVSVKSRWIDANADRPE